MNLCPDVADTNPAKTAPDDCLFAFHGPRSALAAHGPAHMLPRGPVATLEDRLAGAPAGVVVGGALPFDRAGDDCLWLTRTRDATLPAQVPPLPPIRSLRPEPEAADFAAAVARALRIMEGEAGSPDALAKIVLSRALAIEAETPIPIASVMARLGRDPHVTTFRTRLPDGPGHALIGASPELLLRKTGARIDSHPLAGSAPRSTDALTDHGNAEALAHSDKDRREHAFVVEYILDTLAPFCTELDRPQGTVLTHTGSMWHLGTRITGRLRDDTIPAILLAARLHPTPAVCGTPPARAAELIGQLEPHSRGFYAGAVGWSDAQGDGAWFVAIRSAEICGTRARLHAGAGVVLGSDPMAEAAETGAKFGALLSALGLPREAGMIGVTPAR